MLKRAWICECDICGYIEHAKVELVSCNEEIATYPDCWIQGRNLNTHFCPECAKKLEL